MTAGFARTEVRVIAPDLACSRGVESWVHELRQLHDASFGVDWDAHLAALNRKFGFRDESGFRLPGTRCPPGWFNGDVESLSSGAWTLVISINPGANPVSPDWYERHNTPEELWRHWRTYNRDIVRTQSDFFPRLVQVARGILGDFSDGDPSDYATERMLFVELIPYASAKWPPRRVQPGQKFDERAISDFLHDDPGVAICRRIIELVLESARLVLLNGRPAALTVPRAVPGLADVRRVEYQSAYRPTKRLWHLEGLTSGGAVVMGFPLLRSIRGHNANVEIQQLITAGRQLAFGPAEPG